MCSKRPYLLAMPGNLMVKVYMKMVGSLLGRFKYTYINSDLNKYIHG